MRHHALPLTILLLASSALVSDDRLSFDDGRKLLETYCFGCHGGEKPKADVDLSTFRDAKSILERPKLWSTVIRMLREEEMPPKKPLPSVEERKRMIRWVDRTLNDVDWSKIRDPGHVTMPRLTRTEYVNTLRDLLGVDVSLSARLLPDAEGESGFDNDRDTLFLSPALLEKYLATASAVVSEVIARSSKPMAKRFEAEKMFMTERNSPPQPWGYVLNRGQMTLYDSLRFPFDGVYEFKIRAWATGSFSGARLRLDDVVAGDIAVEGKEPADHTLRVFVEAGAHQMAWNIQKSARGASRGANEDTSIEDVDPSDEKKKRKRSKRSTKGLGARVTEEAGKRAPRCPPFDNETPAVAGLRKRLDRTAYSLQRPYEWLRLLGPDGEPKELVRFQGYIRDRSSVVSEAKQALAGALEIKLETLEERYAKHNREILEENRRVLKAAEKAAPAKGPKAPRKKREKKKAKKKAKKEKPGSVAIDWIEVRGPIFTGEIDATQRVFVSHPQGDVTKEQAARTILSRLAPRAFRRPVDDDEIARYLGLFEKASRRGDSFEDAVGLALTGILVSPHFLFRVEHGPERATEFELDEFQLASRLSYFLWLSMPDEELFRLARERRLRDPKVLVSQVRRMIASPKSRAFARAFVGQWLGTSALGRSITPDTKKFRSFTPSLRDAMLDEPVLVFESLVRENRSLLELLDSRRTFLNEELARHYEVDGVVGDAMRAVDLEDEHRGGILAMAGPLAVTSLPLRTSPVLRGKWILETLLGHDLPPPPPDAGDLPEEATKPGGRMTLREAYDRHRREPRCASCHERLDPLGFSLENFDAIGRWRERRDRKPIDAGGVLPDGERFEGVAGLRTVLLARKDEFIRHLATRMLGFSLGRRLRYYDEPTIRRLTRALGENGYRPFSLILAIVSSEPFRKQRQPTGDARE